MKHRRISPDSKRSRYKLDTNQCFESRPGRAIEDRFANFPESKSLILIRKSPENRRNGHAEFALLFDIRLNFTEPPEPQPATFLHWRLHRCEATPFLTELRRRGVWKVPECARLNSLPVVGTRQRSAAPGAPRASLQYSSALGCVQTGRGGAVARLLASYQRETGSIPGGATPGILHVEIVLNDVPGQWVFWGIFRFPRPWIAKLLHTHANSPLSTLKSSIVELQRHGMEQPLADWLREAAGTGLGSEWLMHTSEGFLLAGIPADRGFQAPPSKSQKILIQARGLEALS
ncbi:hypothetical protein PR048_030817 [Dryococelus australis]|uniref:Uncharacterized protein n=1 Tax=Dryococelus australis TaxID=614101 RepID=A0ABQ9G9Z0_9NEOP|nr:hypothetical protein PR048_030817 [Dryococelus australis]